jgi:glycosyltransferase involved in cell wall biosynthesis
MLTVVMPVFNALPYLHEAIASITAQSYGRFRLAIYDDHSTDGSFEAALEWAERDPRVSVTRGAQRLGPSGSSNAAAALADTEFVARMDADDVMVPERLEAQLAVLTRFPDAVMIGSTFDMIDGKGRRIRKARWTGIGGGYPPIAHPSILYRRTALEAIGGYRANTDYFEDRDLYRRMAEHGQIVVINRPLIKVRYAGQHARLNDDPEAVLRKLDRFYAREPAAGQRLSPMSFYSMAYLAMIASKRPNMFGLMLRKACFAEPRMAVPIAAIVGLAELSPRLARSTWRAASALRGMFAATPQSHEEIYVWDPGALKCVPARGAEAAPAQSAGGLSRDGSDFSRAA